LTNGIQHDGYGENWEEMGDMWSLKPVFLLSWALMEDPYPPDDEFVDGDVPDDEQANPYQLCDEAREGIAHLAQLTVQELFDGVPVDGFSADHLRQRFTATCWEPLLWAAPWLWRVSGNPFLDRDGDDYSEPEPWSASIVSASPLSTGKHCASCARLTSSTAGCCTHRLSALAPPYRRRWARRDSEHRPCSICQLPSAASRSARLRRREGRHWHADIQISP
jgi:hypothetical protein